MDFANLFGPFSAIQGPLQQHQNQNAISENALMYGYKKKRNDECFDFFAFMCNGRDGMQASRKIIHRQKNEFLSFFFKYKNDSPFRRPNFILNLTKHWPYNSNFTTENYLSPLFRSDECIRCSFGFVFVLQHA